MSDARSTLARSRLHARPTCPAAAYPVQYLRPSALTTCFAPLFGTPLPTLPILWPQIPAAPARALPLFLAMLAVACKPRLSFKQSPESHLHAVLHGVQPHTASRPPAPQHPGCVPAGGSQRCRPRSPAGGGRTGPWRRCSAPAAPGSALLARGVERRRVLGRSVVRREEREMRVAAAQGLAVAASGGRACRTAEADACS